MPTLAELQTMRETMCEQYMDGKITQSQWRWQWCLYNALVDQHLKGLYALFAR